MRNVSLKFVLATLVVGALLPAFVLATSQARWAHLDRLAALEREGLAQTTKVRSLVERLIVERIALLKGLATSRSLHSRDFAEFYKGAKEAVDPSQGAILVIDRSKRMLLSTVVPFGSPLPTLVDPETAEQAFATGSPQISDLYFSPFTRIPVVAIHVPVPGTDLVLRISMTSRWVNEQLRLILTPSWTYAVADRKGLFLARSRDWEKSIGQPASALTSAMSRNAEIGWSKSVNVEGKSVYVGWQRLPFGWTARASINEEDIARITYAEVRGISLGAAIVMLLGLLFASVAALLIGRPLQRLSTAVEALGRGELPAAERSRISEIDGLREALRGTAAARQAAELEARESERRLRAIVDTAADAIIVIDEGGLIQSINPAGEQMFGFTPGEVVGRNVSMLMPEPHRSLHDDYIARYRDGGPPKIIGIGREVEGRRKDGSTFPADLAVTQWHAGSKRYFTGVLRDITARRRAEEHVRFMMHELSHRTKNILALVEAVAWQTARGSVDLEDFDKRFTQRVQALAASQDLLVNAQWDGVTIEDLVKRQLSPFLDNADKRLDVEGAELVLSPKAAQDLGLIFHELATNASKYGALSGAEGRVEVRWSATSDDIHISWRESGGPTVTVPTRKGFGNQIVERMAKGTFDGKVHLEYAASGFKWELTAPKANLLRTRTGQETLSPAS